MAFEFLPFLKKPDNTIHNSTFPVWQKGVICATNSLGKLWDPSVNIQTII